MIYLASDHGGYDVKEKVKALLDHHGVAWQDLGPYRRQADDDYPDYILPLAELVAEQNGRGIIACRNGQGAAIAANKVGGIRAAVCWNAACAKTSRADDDANILSLPADYLSDEAMKQVVTAWLETPFSADARHIRRLQKVVQYEKHHQEKQR